MGGLAGTYDGLEVLLLMLVVLAAEVGELLLEGALELVEGLDGLVLGGVRGGEVDGLCGGLRERILVSFIALGHPRPGSSQQPAV